MLEQKCGILRAIDGSDIRIGGGVKGSVKYKRIVDGYGGRICLRPVHNGDGSIRCGDCGFRERRLRFRYGCLRRVRRASAAFMEMSRVTVMIMIGAQTAFVLIIVVSAVCIGPSGMGGGGERGIGTAESGERKGAGQTAGGQPLG